MLPAIASMIDEWLENAQEQYRTLMDCKPRPHVLDDSIIKRVFEVYGEQRDDVPLFEEQLRRWNGQGLSAPERAEVDRLSLQMLRVKDTIGSILALARELEAGTIDRVLAKSDEQLGREFKAKVETFAASVGTAPESGFSPEQLKTAAALDKKVKEVLRAGGDDIKLLSEMHDDMHKYKWLLDTAGEAGMTDLCERFHGLHHYGEVLQWFFTAVESGEFEVP